MWWTQSVVPLPWLLKTCCTVTQLHDICHCQCVEQHHCRLYSEQVTSEWAFYAFAHSNRWGWKHFVFGLSVHLCVHVFVCASWWRHSLTSLSSACSFLPAWIVLDKDRQIVVASKLTNSTVTVLCFVMCVCTSCLPSVAYIQCLPSVLWHCWLGGRKGIRPVEN